MFKCCKQANVRSDRFIYLRVPMRFLGFLICLFSIVEFAVGGYVFAFFTNVTAGSWWVSLFYLIAGSAALVGLNKGSLIVVAVSGAIAFFAGIAGCAVDGKVDMAIDFGLACAQLTKDTKVVKISCICFM